MKIAFTYNVRHVEPDINNLQYVREAEFDTPETIAGITKALESLSHQVFKVEADENAYRKLKKLKKKIDLVFNIAEGIYGADREAQIPAMLEMLQIPYTGPKPLGYAVGLNKSVAKEILSYFEIPTSQWLTINNLSELEPQKINFYPVIAKPCAEGSSKGISARNLVNDFEGLKKIAAELLDQYQQPVLVEKYLAGREFTVALLGNPPKVLPIIEVIFDELPKEMPRFDHYEAKWVFDNPEKGADPLVCPAQIDSKLEEEIKNCCLKAFSALKMADWARFDLRLDEKNIPNIIEVNCPPGIIPNPKENSRFPRAALAAGLSYEQMIEEILKSVCSRYGIEYH